MQCVWLILVKRHKRDSHGHHGRQKRESPMERHRARVAMSDLKDEVALIMGSSCGIGARRLYGSNFEVYRHLGAQRRIYRLGGPKSSACANRESAIGWLPQYGDEDLVRNASR